MKQPKKTISDFTDRELQESIYKSLKRNESSTNIISIWIQVWSWISVVGLALWIFMQISNS